MNYSVNLVIFALTKCNLKIINRVTVILNRKIKGFDDITTPAGIFKCYIIDYDVALKMMFKLDFKITEWVAEGIGSVISETRDSGGKLNGSNLLTRFIN